MSTKSGRSHHAASATTTERFSRLPAEIRNGIYSYALTFSEPIEVSKQDIRSRTALLRVCNQIRSEASTIFYKSNDFRVSDIEAQTEDVATFLDLAGKENASCITKLTLSFDMIPKLQTLIDQALIDDSFAPNGFSLRVIKTSREMFETLSHAGVKRKAVMIEKLEVRDVYPDASTNQLLKELGGIFEKSMRIALANSA
ncbi:hypothetical protein LTR37_013732 [Vermiconidia calcicola]|uniref:Uncharacterized protein n=1 Tax=Vermiconidia calcicola TaxID=1690605 RepID=A0ACC3MX73_9PEZI|nr:hypothetical protein LTR37_013732 [Vermiconidia calcicola]